MAARVRELATALKKGLLASGLRLRTPMSPVLSGGVCTVEIAPDRRRRLVSELDARGIAGSPAGGLRLCPHVYNTMEHIERAVDAATSLSQRVSG